jgi:hypothetical protein
MTMKNAVFWDVTPVLTRATRRHIPEDGILRSPHREDLKSYNFMTSFEKNCCAEQLSRNCKAMNGLRSTNNHLLTKSEDKLTGGAVSVVCSRNKA